MQTKTCSKCKQEKSTEEFYKHSQKKDGLNSSCRKCEQLHNKSRAGLIKEYNKIYHSQYYELNKERVKKKSLEYYINNKDEIAQKCKKKYIINKDIVNNKNKINYLKNKDSILKTSAIYYKNNRDKILEYQKEYEKKYRKTEMGKAVRKNINHKRRSTIKDGNVKSLDIFNLQNNAKVCYWCNTSLKEKKMHIDHYIPLSKGGEHTLSNLVVSCEKCNKNKCAKDPIKFANSIGKLL